MADVILWKFLDWQRFQRHDADDVFPPLAAFADSESDSGEGVDLLRDDHEAPERRSDGGAGHERRETRIRRLIQDGDIRRGHFLLFNHGIAVFVAAVVDQYSSPTSS